MALPKEIIRMLSQKAGFDVDTPAGANRLSLVMDLKEETSLGRNTISRLTGVLPSTTTPRRSTLDAIAVFLGFENWVDFLEINPALKDAHYSKHSKFSRNYHRFRESDWNAGCFQAYTMQYNHVLAPEACDSSRWSTWTDYSFRIYV